MSELGGATIGMVLIVLFWASFILAIHPYITYPIIILFWSILRPKPPKRAPITPFVSLIIVAHNEQRLIKKRIDNLLSLDWPEGKLDVIVSSDGSTDQTNAVVRDVATGSHCVQLLDLPRGGRCAAINSAVEKARGEVVVLTDASTHFEPDVLRKLIPYFADEEVDCVVGRITMVPSEESSMNFSEGLYWRFEARLRELEAKAGVAFIGSGACIAARRKKFPLLDMDASDDLTAVIRLVVAGGRALQVSDVEVYDYMDGDVSGQLRSRRRRLIRSMTTIAHNRAILNPFRHPGYAFCVLSHKLLRWLSPVWLIGMLVASLLLMRDPFYRIVFFSQAAFYVLGLGGWALHRYQLSKFALLSLPMAFCVANVAFLRGLGAFVLGKRLQEHRSLEDTHRAEE